jgi:hypothetical protein
MKREMDCFLKTLAGIVIAFGLLFISGLPAYAAQEGDSGKWQFSLTPYLWLPSINGDLKFSIPPGSGGTSDAGGSPDVKVGPNDYLGALNFAMLLKGEVRKSDWAVFTDIIYLNLSDQKGSVKSINGPGGAVEIPINADTSMGFSGLCWQLAGSYTVAGSKSTTLDIVGGARYFGLKASVDWQFDSPLSLFPGSGSLSERKDLLDAIVGVRGKVGFCKNWFIPYYLDVGTGSSELTSQGLVGIGYSFKCVDVLLTYRYLYYDQNDDKLLQNFSLSGPALGVNIRF